ncbi:hypothetical protein V8G54_023908 [Vigna mungo]|uniref:Uncharacterized protein n=1 Tax=Vigna mungo TaxID=3915 RepID=A0AAQ3N572_VIGMU
MEQQNLSDTDQFLTLGATSDESQSPKEAAPHISAADNNNNAVSAVNVTTGPGSDTEALANSDAVAREGEASEERGCRDHGVSVDGGGADAAVRSFRSDQERKGTPSWLWETAGYSFHR